MIIDKQIINQNIYDSKHGLYKDLPIFKPIKINANLTIPPPLSAPATSPKIYVTAKHPFEVIKNNIINQEHIALLYTVGKEFDGTRLELHVGLRDHAALLLQTNFSAALLSNNEESVFPITDPTECIYMKKIYRIRDQYHRAITTPLLPSFSLIVIAPVYKPVLLDSENSKIMCSADFIKTISVIDSAFKIAISESHRILVLTCFDPHIDENPITDILKIFILCILKYGNRFDEIYITLMPTDNSINFFMTAFQTAVLPDYHPIHLIKL